MMIALEIKGIVVAAIVKVGAPVPTMGESVRNVVLARTSRWTLIERTSIQCDSRFL